MGWSVSVISADPAPGLDGLDVESLVACDPDAWDRFRARFDIVVIRAVRRALERAKVYTCERLQDAVQNVYVHLLEHDGKALRAYTPGPCPPERWLGMVAKHATQDWIKHNGYFQDTGYDPPQEEMPTAGAESSCAPEVLDQRELFKSALEKLTAVERQIFSQLFVEWLTVDEAASRLGVCKQTVYNLRCTIRKKFRAAMHHENRY